MARRDRQGGARISPTGVRIAAYHQPPADAAQWVFSNAKGTSCHWNLGCESADEFASRDGGLHMAGEVFFRGTTVRIFLSVLSDKHALRVIKVKGPITLLKILREIERTAQQTAAKYLMTMAPPAQRRSTVTEKDADEVLRGSRLSRMLLRRSGGSNQVYVQFSGSTGSVMSGAVKMHGGGEEPASSE